MFARTRAKTRPGKHRQAQVDGCGIERVDRFGERHGKSIVDIQPTRRGNEPLCEVGVQPPVAARVGVGERVARDLAANPQMIELAALRSRAGFDVAQALAIGQLREGHAQVLIEAREALDLVLGLVARDAATKRVQRQVLHQLRENRLARVHRRPRRLPEAQGRQTGARRSSR